MPDGNSVLLVAAGSGHGELGVLLLDHGANLNAATKEEGLTALHALILKRPLHCGALEASRRTLRAREGAPRQGRQPESTSPRRRPAWASTSPAHLARFDPFMLAARVADIEMMKLLAEARRTRVSRHQQKRPR